MRFISETNSEDELLSGLDGFDGKSSHSALITRRPFACFLWRRNPFMETKSTTSIKFPHLIKFTGEFTV